MELPHTQLLTLHVSALPITVICTVIFREPKS